MKKGYLSLLLLLSMASLPTGLLAQNLKIYSLTGLTVGSPLGEIPEGATGAPGTDIHLGLSFVGRLATMPAWSLGLDAIYTRQKSTYASPITGETTVSTEVFGIDLSWPFPVSYEGQAEGAYDNRYREFDLWIRRGQNRWQGGIGVYYAQLIKGQNKGAVDIRVANLFNIENEPFDESAFVNTQDWGLLAGFSVRVFWRASLYFRAKVGMMPVMSQNPEGLEGIYRNVYLSTGVKFLLLDLP